MLNVLAFCFLCGSIIGEANYPIKNLTFVGDGTMSLTAGNGAKGGEGGIDLANKVIENINDECNYEPLYDLNDSIYDKIFKIASKAYGANDVIYADSVKEEIEKQLNNLFRDRNIFNKNSELI